MRQLFSLSPGIIRTLLKSSLVLSALVTSNLMAATISLTHTPNPAVASQDLTYQIDVSEPAGRPCRNARLVLNLPPGVSYKFSHPSGSPSANAVTWYIGWLHNSTRTYKATVTVDAGVSSGSLDASASLSGSSCSAQTSVSTPVTSNNQPPVAYDDAYSTLEDTALNVPAPGPLGNDTDPDGDPLSLTVQSQPSHGTLVASADGQFTYTPNTGYSGLDSFTYSANDSDLDSNIATVQITVKPVNRPPVANNDAYSTQQDVVLKIASPGILANDSDPEGSPLTATIVSQPLHGVLIATADGFFTYTPNAGYTGVDTFTYQANDGVLDSNTATVQITVSPPPNRPPVANNDTYSMPQDTVLNVAASGILANDVDPEGHTLTASIESLPLHGTLTASADGQFIYTPNAGYTGSDSFTYKANDGDLDSSSKGRVSNGPALYLSDLCR